jgi:hypothetical protein
VRPTGGCAPDSEVPTLGPDRRSGALGALLGTEAGRAQDPPSRRGRCVSTLVGRACQHRGGQGPGSSQPTRVVCLDTSRTRLSAQRRAGPRIPQPTRKACADTSRTRLSAQRRAGPRIPQPTRVVCLDTSRTRLSAQRRAGPRIPQPTRKACADTSRTRLSAQRRAGPRIPQPTRKACADSSPAQCAREADSSQDPSAHSTHMRAIARACSRTYAHVFALRGTRTRCELHSV